MNIHVYIFELYTCNKNYKYYIFEYIFYIIKDEEKQKIVQIVVLVEFMHAIKHRQKSTYCIFIKCVNQNLNFVLLL